MISPCSYWHRFRQDATAELWRQIARREQIDGHTREVQQSPQVGQRRARRRVRVRIWEPQVKAADINRQLASPEQPGQTETMQRRPPRTLAVLVALGAAAALGIAYAAEVWGELVPCALCLVERWPYRVVVVLGVLAAIAPRGLVRTLLALAIICLLADAAVAAVHVGVELHWWPSPLPECAAPHLSGSSITERLASMPARPGKPCDEPSFLIPAIPLSMAAMNLLFALAFAVVLTISLAVHRSRR
jgi:disulfide bond formation protein DsbB